MPFLHHPNLLVDRANNTIFDASPYPASIRDCGELYFTDIIIGLGECSALCPLYTYSKCNWLGQHPEHYVPCAKSELKSDTRKWLKPHPPHAAVTAILRSAGAFIPIQGTAMECLVPGARKTVILGHREWLHKALPLQDWRWNYFTDNIWDKHRETGRMKM